MPKNDCFRNVDLEVRALSRTQLGPLGDVLQCKLFELFRGRIRGLYRVHYEVSACGHDASASIRELAAVIEGLNRSEWRAWDAATKCQRSLDPIDVLQGN